MSRLEQRTNPECRLAGSMTEEAGVPGENPPMQREMIQDPPQAEIQTQNLVLENN
ncbi:hypothetical protein ILYODFUR_010698, partial [Ilyodon furcidens]